MALKRVKGAKELYNLDVILSLGLYVMTVLFITATVPLKGPNTEGVSNYPDTPLNNFMMYVMGIGMVTPLILPVAIVVGVIISRIVIFFYKRSGNMHDQD